jgi:hypothetical protein
MATTEIEKLERRYAENPQGLTFAPLAEVHRKNGDVTRALELLKAGLELHPNYIPASIVLGRCHWDLGDLPAAESAFAHVLRLDDENVIALKSLADINEKLERFTEAQRWLNRLISVDRSNEEARQQLARLEAAKQPRSSSPPLQDAGAAAAPPKQEPPVPAPWQKQEETQPYPGARNEAPAAPSQPKVKEEETPAPAPLRPSAGLEPSTPEPAGEADRIEKSQTPVLEFIDTGAPTAPAAGPPREELPAAEPAERRAEEPAPMEGLISQEFVPPRDSYRSHPELTQEFVEPASSREPDLEPLEVETAGEVELQSSGASEFRVPNAAEDFMEAAFTAPVSRPADLPVIPPAEARPAPPPGPSAPAAPTSAPDFELSIPAASSSSRRGYSVQETKGQSVAAFFAALLRARPAGASPAVANQTEAKVQAAQDPVPPPGSRSDAAAGPVGDATVSFDDLFGTSAETSPSPKGGADAGKEDLDEFQTWLQNLKR